MFATRHLPYNQTNAFSTIVLDYLQEEKNLRPFFASLPSIEGVKEILQQKMHQKIDRHLLSEVLLEQYESINASAEVKKNIALLLSEKTFTICTAHQPNLFTGPLYFIYKILHAIKLSAVLKKELPDYNFVPVYYMGSEDADFAELNHTYVEGKKIEWSKKQKGAVGRMLVDKTLMQLIGELESQLYAAPNGKEVIALLKKSYTEGKTIQSATFELVNELYGAYGLIVLIPDHPALKAQMKKVFEDDLFQNIPSSIVQKTSARLAEHYEAQAYPRPINLFYLKDDIRERIEFKNGEYLILNTTLSFSENALRSELAEHPERFSPNVILRGLYQEMILPDIAFVGGGGELAYWLQLKDLFDHYKIVFPLLVLRNSFLIVEKQWMEKTRKLGMDITDFFLSQDEIMNRLVSKYSDKPISLNGNFEKAEALFEQIKTQAGEIDPSLSQHVAAIKTRSLKTLQELEKKMMRAEKRKFSEQQIQIEKIRSILFPGNGLQERVENFSGFYAKWGDKLIEQLYLNSLAMEQEFTVLMEE